jgi:hypothetical protein
MGESAACCSTRPFLATRFSLGPIREQRSEHGEGVRSYSEGAPKGARASKSVPNVATLASAHFGEAAEPVCLCGGARRRVGFVLAVDVAPPPVSVATWLILPVVICLSQRLSHACLSISLYMVKPRMAH